MRTRSKKLGQSAVLAIAALAVTVAVAAGIVAGCGTAQPPVEKIASTRQPLASSNGFSQNGLTTNGLVSNGAWFNGAWFNGAWFNGAWFNGAWFNGAWFNGAWFNGAWFNGAWFNGAWFNGLFSNTLWSNGISTDGGPPAAGSPAAALQSSAYLRQLLPYIYGCAMPGALDPITNTPIDPKTYNTVLDPNNGALKCAPPDVGGEDAGADGGPACPDGYTCSLQGTCVIPLSGAIGLAINADGTSWWGELADGTVSDSGVGDGAVGDGGVGGAAGTCDETCQRWVSACVLARTNAYGAHVEISMRAPANAPQAIKNALATSPTEVATFSLREGAYYGNIFETTPTPLICSGPSSSCARPGPQSAGCYTDCVSAGPPSTPDGGPYTGPATGPVAEVPAFYACSGPGSNTPQITKRFCSSPGDQVVIGVPGVCLTNATDAGVTEPGACAGEDTDGGSPTFGAIQHCYTSTAATSANPCTSASDPTCFDQVITIYLKEPVAVCGNGVCETFTEPDGGVGGENSTSCPSDCHPFGWAQSFNLTAGSAGISIFDFHGASTVSPIDDSIVLAGFDLANTDVSLGGTALPGLKENVVVGKYDPSGNYLNGSGFSMPAARYAVVAAGDGSITVGGFLPPSGGSLFSLAKLTADAQPTPGWPIAFGTGSASGNAGGLLAADSSGDVFVAEQYQGTATFATTPPTTLTSDPNGSVLVAKVLPDGTPAWAVSIANAAPNSIAVDPTSGDVLLAVELGQSTTAESTELLRLSTSSGGDAGPTETPSIVKASPTWSAFTVGPPPSHVFFANVVADSTGSLYATGDFNGSYDFGPGCPTATATTAYGEFFLVKYSPDGSQCQWVARAAIQCPAGAQYCIDGLFEGGSLAFDHEGNVVVGGQLSALALAMLGQFTPPPGSGAVVDFGAGPFETFRYPNAFAASYDPGGNFRWAKQIPIVLQGNLRGLSVDSKDHVVVSGTYTGSMEVDNRLLVNTDPERVSNQNANTYLASFAAPSTLDTAPPAIGAGSDQTGAPLFTVPAPIVAEATSQCGANVFFTMPTVIDNGFDGGYAGTSVTCSPPPNSMFPINTSTTVTCTASLGNGASQSSATFTVTVADTLAPTFLPFANVAAQAPPGASSVPVPFAPTATDQVDCSSPASVDAGTGCTPTSNPCTPVSCTPASGSPFPIGTTPVTCTATDKSNNTSQMTFSVTVMPPFGETCSSTGQCAFGSCVDGVCCNTTATSCGQCQTCNAPGSAGTCSPTTGGACDDGNACTQNDTCQAGVCTGSNSVTCVASDQCHAAGTCDPSSGTCSNPNAPDGTACNDGNACTQTDTCKAGTCTGGNPVTCTAKDACHLAGTCDPTTGTCSNPPAPAGTAGCNGTPSVGSFAVYATESIDLNSNASITGCNVGVENSSGLFLAGGAAAYLASGAKIQSSQTLYASSVSLASGASIGPVDTNKVTKATGATYGKVSAFPVMPPPPAAPPAKAGTTAITLGTGASKTLASGAYGSVSVGSSATLKLTGGNYVFSSLTLGTGATLAVTASTVISVTGSASVGSSSFMGPASGSGLTAKALVVYFDGATKVVLGSGATVRALLVAPNALVTVSTSSFSGAIAAAQVVLSTGVSVACEDGLGGLSTANTITVSIAPTESCGGGIEGDSIGIVIADSSDTLNVSTPSMSGASATFTLPTAVTTGSTYNVTVTTTSDVYTCTFDSTGQSNASGIVEGPVNLSVTCIRNNC